MRGWLVGLSAGVACVLASWALLLVLARRLPPGMARDLAALIPACVTVVRRLRKDPRVPRSAKFSVLIVGLWVASPIDLIPGSCPSSVRSTTSWSLRLPCEMRAGRSPVTCLSPPGQVNRSCSSGSWERPLLTTGHDGLRRSQGPAQETV